MNLLSPEAKLDIALFFLKEKHQGSFMYYENNDISTERNLNGANWDDEQQTRLIFCLEKNGIDPKEYLPIIMELERDGYIDLYYNSEKQREKEIKGFPSQIRLSYKGIKSKGYVRDENIEWVHRNIPIIISIIALFLTIIGLFINMLKDGCC